VPFRWCQDHISKAKAGSVGEVESGSITTTRTTDKDLIGGITTTTTKGSKKGKKK
jgi:hypothetical protein